MMLEFTSLINETKVAWKDDTYYLWKTIESNFD